MIDTTNLFMVASQGNEVIILKGIPEGTKLSKKVAMNLAAWLVAIGDSGHDDPEGSLFQQTLEAVQNT